MCATKCVYFREHIGILAAASVFVCVSLTQVMDHLLVTGCGCSPQGKETEPPSLRDPQGLLFIINQATLLKVTIRS